MSSEIADPYHVLGISRTADAEELKRAYRRQSKVWHPDLHTTASDANRAEADRRFRLINAAYVAVGEILRTKAEVQTAASQGAVNEQSDARVEAIKSVVASAALRVIPNVPRHTYRRIVSMVEGILLDTIALENRAFSEGFDTAIREAMIFASLGNDSRADALRVLDAASDDLQWRGKGADPETWQKLLRPLEEALHPNSAKNRRATPKPAAHTSAGELLRKEPVLLAAQVTFGLLFLVLLMPMLPLASIPRVALLFGSLAGLGYVTFWVPRV